VTPDSNGADVFSGGLGVDTADYVRVDGGLSVSLDDRQDDGELAERDNIGSDVENVIGGPENDVIVGNDSNNILDGRGSDDSIAGLGGDDQLIGGARDVGSDVLDGGDGRDSLDGGAGDDRLDGGAGAEPRMAGGPGSDSLEGGPDDDYMEGGAGIDDLAGGPGNDALDGGGVAVIGADGGDKLEGAEGNDSLTGGFGDDTLDGGAGADLYSGGPDDDVADYGLRESPLFVTFDGVANDGEAGERDNIGTDVEEVRGGEDRDDLIGNRASNDLAGNDGEDYVDGDVGANDKLRGGADRDTVRARDGLQDTVTCGPDRDFAIVDAKDIVKGCERVDRGMRNRPVVADSAVIQPRAGLRMRLAGTRRFVPLRDKINLPLGSAVDATRGSVRMAFARPRSRRGSRRRQSAVFSEGRFVASQKRRQALVELRLEGGSFRSCRQRLPRQTQAARHLSIRRLRGRARGRYRTRGRYSATTVRGTTWLVEERCEGTFTKVSSGTAIVRDHRRGRNIVLGAGESYLARAG
jgi:Ca2+-binding RTX toxin-like protein